MKNFLLSLSLIIAMFTVNAQVLMNTANGSYTQNFDAMGIATGAWADNTNLPNWYAKASVFTTLTLTADDGTSNSGGLKNYGTTSATERALGSISSGSSGILTYGVLLKNTCGQTLTSIRVQYTGEQWRDAGKTTPPDQDSLYFFYQISSAVITDLTPASDISWTAAPQLDAISLISNATATKLDGNLPANRTSLDYTISSLSIPDGQYIMLRWKDKNDLGSDHAIALDDLTITWAATNSISNVETNNLSVFPIPATSSITISANEILNFVQIFDVQGKLVMEYDFNGTSEIKLNVAELPKGLYNIVANSTNGKVYSSKFVK